MVEISLIIDSRLGQRSSQDKVGGDGVDHDVSV